MSVTSICTLPEELLRDIFRSLTTPDPGEDDSTASRGSKPPPSTIVKHLKALSQTSKRFHRIASEYLFSEIRLRTRLHGRQLLNHLDAWTRSKKSASGEEDTRGDLFRALKHLTLSYEADYVLAKPAEAIANQMHKSR